MFAITEAMKTKGKMVNVVVLSQKNRAPDENPGAKLSIEVQLPAAMLAHFAPKLPSMLFEAAAGDGAAQGSLEGEVLILARAGWVGALIEGHDDVGAEVVLDLHASTGRQLDERAVDVAFEDDAGVGDLVDVGQ